MKRLYLLCRAPTSKKRKPPRGLRQSRLQLPTEVQTKQGLFKKILTNEELVNERESVLTEGQLRELTLWLSDVEIIKAGNQTVSSGIIQPATVPVTSFDKKLAQLIS